MDIFCASPASTAICSSMEHRSMVRRGPRPIDHRRNPHIHDRRKSQPPRVPCSSQFPINPKPYYEKYRRSSASQSDLRRQSSADINNLNSSPAGSSRYLLSDSPFIDWISSDSSDQPTASALVPAEPAKPRRLSSNIDSPALKSSLSARSHDQVPFNLSFCLENSFYI